MWDISEIKNEIELSVIKCKFSYIWIRRLAEVLACNGHTWWRDKFQGSASHFYFLLFSHVLLIDVLDTLRQWTLTLTSSQIPSPAVTNSPQRHPLPCCDKQSTATSPTLLWKTVYGNSQTLPHSIYLNVAKRAWCNSSLIKNLTRMSN